MTAPPRDTPGPLDVSWNDLINRALVQVHDCGCNLTLSRCLQCRLARLLLLCAEECQDPVPRTRNPSFDIVYRRASPGGMQTVGSEEEEEEDFGPNGDLGFGALTLEEVDGTTKEEFAMEIDRNPGMDINTDLGVDIGTDLAMGIDSKPGMDTNTDLGVNTGTDLAMDIDSKPGVDVDMDANTDVGTDVNMDVNMDVNTDVDMDTSMVPDTDAGDYLSIHLDIDIDIE